MLSHRRAMKRTLIMAFFLSIPVGILIFAQINWERTRSDLVPLEPFFFKTTDQQFLTNDHLKGHITAILLFPHPCEAPCQSSLPLTVEMEQFVEKNLRGHQVTLISWQAPQGTLSSQWKQLLPEESQETEIRRLFQNLNLTQKENTITLVILDRLVRIAGVYAIESSQVELYQKALSRILFDQYLFEYLSTRTFFGPKRNVF